MRFRTVASKILMVSCAVSAASACVGDTPAKDIAAPDLSKVALFFPVDNLVPGRGEAGTFADPSVSFVYVASHPLETDDTFAVDEDGSFTFSILGVSGDVIEIAGSRDDKGLTRGESVYFRVPPLPAAGSHYFCCPDTLVCVSDEDYVRNNKVCPQPDSTLATVCQSAVECRELNNEILPINNDDLMISQPDATGRVQVQGHTDTPGALMRMENRGLRSIGGYNPGSVRSVISDSNGFFRFKDVLARGDDELVFQTYDLLGYRSPEAPKHVPDAELAGVDVLGVYAFGRLVESAPGYIVVRVSPYGVDGRGICPDSTDAPTLCFSGGLTRRMVSVENPLLQKTFPLTLEDPPDDALPAGISYDLATEGDPLKGTQSIVLVMDLSDNASMVDAAPPARFDAAWRFVRTLRKRDRLAIVSFGVNTPSGVRREVQFKTIGENFDYFQQYLTATMPPLQDTGPSKLLKGIEEAADMLGAEAGSTQGTIVVITMSEQAADDAAAKDFDADKAFLDVFEKVKPVPEEDALYRVYVVGAQIPSTIAPDPMDPEAVMPSNFNIYVKSLADFSGGRATNVPLVPLITDPLEKLAGEIGGSYSILYQTFIPCTGKNPDIELTVRASLPTGMQTGTFKGSLRVDAAGPTECQ